MYHGWGGPGFALVTGEDYVEASLDAEVTRSAAVDDGNAAVPQSLSDGKISLSDNCGAAINGDGLSLDTRLSRRALG